MSSQNQQFQDEADKDKNLNQELDEAQKHPDSICQQWFLHIKISTCSGEDANDDGSKGDDREGVGQTSGMSFY